MNPVSILWLQSGARIHIADDSLRESDDSSQEELEAAIRALANERVSVPPVRSNRKNRLPPIYPLSLIHI